MRKCLVVILVLLFSSVAMAQSLKEITWITEEYPPYNYSENGVPKGIGVDMLLEIMKRNKTPIQAEDIKVFPWQRGVKTVKTKPGTCLFATTKTSQREKEFQWRFACEIPRVTEASDDHVIARKAANIKVESMDDLKKLDQIGVVRGDIGEALLLESGIGADKMDKASDGTLLIKKLLKKRYDIISYGKEPAKAKMIEEGMNPDDYESVFIFPPKPLGYAFHKDTDPDLVGKFQGLIDELYKDGTVDKIFKKYVN